MLRNFGVTDTKRATNEKSDEEPCVSCRNDATKRPPPPSSVAFRDDASGTCLGGLRARTAQPTPCRTGCLAAPGPTRYRLDGFRVRLPAAKEPRLASSGVLDPALHERLRRHSLDEFAIVRDGAGLPALVIDQLPTMQQIALLNGMLARKGDGGLRAIGVVLAKPRDVVA